MPDSLEELCRLTGVERPEEIGLNGPAIGARVTEENANEAALRLFEVVFGRDSLSVALVVGDLFPRLLETTVLYLAGIQGREFDALREEEPGRIAHEIREVEMDGLWGFPYYGSVDATPLFIRAAVRAMERWPEFAATPVPARQASVRDSLMAAVDWLLPRLAGDDLGLLSHRRSDPDGLENQVWKDSWDSMSHADGAVCNHDPPLPLSRLRRSPMTRSSRRRRCTRIRPGCSRPRPGSSRPSRSIFGSMTPRVASTRSGSTASRSPARRGR
jgi:hypothetical protein